MNIEQKILSDFQYFDHFYVKNRFWTTAQIFREKSIVKSITGPNYFGNSEGIPDQMLLPFFGKYRVPEAWHNYILGINWDSGVTKGITWVLNQEECDAGTALWVLQFMDPSRPSAFDMLAFNKAAAGGFKRFKIPIQFDHTALMKSVRSNHDLNETLLAGCKRLENMKAERIHYDVPHSSDESGFCFFAYDEDYNGRLHEEVKKRGLLETERANPASQLVFGVH